jgi:hypothetical protein
MASKAITSAADRDNRSNSSVRDYDDSDDEDEENDEENAKLEASAKGVDDRNEQVVTANAAATAATEYNPNAKLAAIKARNTMQWNGTLFSQSAWLHLW